MLKRNYRLSPKITGFLLICYCIIIFTISSMSHPTRNYHLQKGPKNHFIEYGGLGVLSFLYFFTKKNTITKSAFLAIVFSGAYAVSDEIHQYFTPYRECELEDVIIDIIGSSFGIAICFTFFKFTLITFNNRGK